MTPRTSMPAGDYGEAFPGSYRIHDEATVDGPDGPLTVRVPTREVRLTNGATVRLYDTSGPRVGDVREGLPKLREPWIASRRGQPVVTQLHYARRHAHRQRAARPVDRDLVVDAVTAWERLAVISGGHGRTCAHLSALPSPV